MTASTGSGRRRSVAVVSAGLRQPSSTRLLADQLGAAVDRALRLLDSDEPPRVEIVELRDMAHPLVDNLLTGFPSGALADAVELVREADAVVVVTPVFNASYNALLKAFVDVLDKGTLDGKPVLVAATGGTARHSLAIDYALRPLFAHLRASVVPTAVFAASEDFGAGGGSTALSARVDRAARELADAVHARPRQAASDPFALTTSFEDLLRG